MFLQHSCQEYQSTLAKYGSYAIECGTPSHIERLFLFREPKNIEAVCSNVVCSATEGHQPEECQ